MAEDIYQASLRYHMLNGRPGKVEVVPTKPVASARDLSLAYSPGVAEPCRQIHADPGKVFDYTNRGNLVAVITNGTAVLGLGDIGPLAGKPVMEGKGVLFKKFADIDVYDIEVDRKDPDAFIEAVCAIAPTFGGINLEDIKGPDCFHIEEELTKRLDIPVFHDDQHGTAIIAGAAFLNACDLTGRDPADVRCVFNGAGAAGIATAKLFLSLGVKREHLILCDSTGVIYEGRSERMNPHKAPFAIPTDARSLGDAMIDAHCFVGCSVGNVVSPDMLKSMAPDPIVFAMANPEPEIDYPLAIATRPDVIMATGRSDYPNQVNNVLGFPFIFRGALDTRSKGFNEEMKLAAVKSLAQLAREPVPESVSRAYGGERFSFGKEYLIPKPFDPRVLYWESVAVAEAAMNSGLARRHIDLDEYRARLQEKVDAGRSLVGVTLRRSEPERQKRARIAIAEADYSKLASAVRRAIDECLCYPVLVGPTQKVREAMGDTPESEYEVLDPAAGKHADELISTMRRQRPLALENKNDDELKRELLDPYLYATLLTEAGVTDGLLAASGRPYNEMVRPIVTYASRRAGVSRVAGVHLLALKDRSLFFTDTTLIADPSAEELAEIALRASRAVRRLNITPRVAFVSYSNYSRRSDPDIIRLRRAYKLVRQIEPELECYGDVQIDAALEPERFKEVLGDRLLSHPANVLVFPNLFASNAAFRVARVIGNGTSVGPVLLGLRRPANVLPRGTTEEEIFNLLAVTSYNAQRRAKEIRDGVETRLWNSGTKLLSVVEDDEGAIR